MESNIVMHFINTIFQDILPVVGDVCLFFISVYTFRLTILPNKLRFIGYRPSFSAFEGDSVEITLENRSLSPAVIQSISLVLDEHIIEIFSERDSEPCIIDGFKTGKIKMIPYSRIYIEDGEIDLHTFKKWYLIVGTPRGKQYLSYAHGPKKRFLKFYNKRHPPKQASVLRNYYNGKIVKPYVRYALVYKGRNDDIHTVFIHKSGAMSEAPFGYNGLPKEVVADKDKLYSHFEGEFSKYDIPFAIKEFALDDGNILT